MTKTISMSPKISIISPTYNVEKYIAFFITSIQNQLFQDWEIIAVNDGSTDGSLAILEKFAQEDNRIKIFNKKNGGINTARNLGLQHATGKYITFVDPDDLLPVNSLQTLYDTAEEKDLDIVVGQIYDIYTCNGFDSTQIKQSNLSLVPTVYQNKVIQWQDLDFYSFYLCTWFISCSAKLFKKKLWQDVLFHENIYMAEDQVTVKEVALNSRRIGIIADYVYIYRRRAGSNTAKRKDIAFDVFKSYETMIELFKRKGLYDACHVSIKKSFFELYFWHMLHIAPYRTWFNFLTKIKNQTIEWGNLGDLSSKEVDYYIMRIERLRTSSRLGFLTILLNSYSRLLIANFKIFTIKLIDKTMGGFRKVLPVSVRKCVYSSLSLLIKLLNAIKIRCL